MIISIHHQVSKSKAGGGIPIPLPLPLPHPHSTLPALYYFPKSHPATSHGMRACPQHPPTHPHTDSTAQSATVRDRDPDRDRRSALLVVKSSPRPPSPDEPSPKPGAIRGRRVRVVDSASLWGRIILLIPSYLILFIYRNVVSSPLHWQSPSPGSGRKKTWT